MKLREINKVLFFTLLVFSMCILNSYPETGAKYIIDNAKERNYSLIYSTDILKMTYTTPQSSHRLINGTTYNKALFEMIIPRSGLYRSTDSKQIYTIEAPIGCLIESVSSQDTTIKNTKSMNTATLEYNATGTGNITIKYSCPISVITENINSVDKVVSELKVYEKITPEQSEKHLYMFGKYSENLSRYLELYPLPVGIISADKKTYTLPKDSTNKFNNFKGWIEEYMNVYGNIIELKNTILSYYGTVYNSDSSVIDITNTLDGISATYDDNSENYIFVIDDNFIGYALNFANSESLGLQIYYISDFENETEVFKTYLTKYQFYNEYSNEDIIDIQNYIDIKGGIENCSSSIAVTNYYDGDNKLVYKQLIINNKLLTIAKIVLSGYIEIPFDIKTNMFNSFKSTVSDIYSDILSNNFISILNATNTISSTLRTSIIKNAIPVSGTFSPISYTDYHVFYDEGNDYWVSFKISSTGVDSVSVVVDKIEINKESDENILHNNTNNTTEIKILDNANTSTRLNDIITALDAKGITNHASYYNNTLLDYVNYYTYNDPNYTYTSAYIDSVFDGTYYTFTLK